MNMAVESGAHLVAIATRYTVVLPMPQPDDRHKPLLGSFIWIAARASLVPSIRIKRAGSRDPRQWLESPDAGAESDVTGTTKAVPRPGTFAIYRLPGSLLIERLP